MDEEIIGSSQKWCVSGGSYATRTTQIGSSYLDNYISLINKIVPIVQTEVVYNLGETRLSDWENLNSKPVLVPAAKKDSTLHYPINRFIRHQTLLWCVTASGDSYCPMLIRWHAGARKLFETGGETTSISWATLDNRPTPRRIFSTVIQRTSSFPP
jgi:hypothetical protein